MKENIFTLTKREQRAIIAIVLALLIATTVVHYRSLRSNLSPPTVSTAPTPEEQAGSPGEPP